MLPSPPMSTPSVDTTDSLAIKPEIRAVAARQSPKPSGAKMGAMSRPTAASRLSVLSATTFSRASKVCRNQMMHTAKKITVKALWRKSFAFSQQSCHTLLREGKR